MAMTRVANYMSTRVIAVLLCLAASVSPVNSDLHANHLSAKVQVVHPFQAMVLRATDISPIVFYGENGRVHMEYRPILPKFLFTVSVIGELMRGVGATVNDVLHRASVVYPVPHYGAIHSPFYPYTYYKESSSPLYQHSSTSNHHPEQRSRDDNSSTNSNSTKAPPTDSSTPTPVQITLSSQIRNKYIRPPLMVQTPPSKPQQNMLEVLSKAISGA